MTYPAFPKPTRAPKEPSRLQRKTPMKRSGPIRAKRADERKRVGTDRDDSPRRKAVRLMECVVKGMRGATHCRGDVVAAHVACGPNEKGMALKVPDAHVVPMCTGCHDQWDGRDNGKGTTFYRWSKPRRWRMAQVWVRRVDHALVPDTHDQALAFAEIGLGRIEARGSGWAWVAGPERAA